MATEQINSPDDAIALLKADHRRFEALFKDFEDSRENHRKIKITQKICTELTAHLLAGEKIFYSALYETLNGNDHKLLHAALVEHASLKELIANLCRSSPQDIFFDAHLSVLKEYVRRHIEVEEAEMMPRAKERDLDFAALARGITSVKATLKSTYYATTAPPFSTEEERPQFAA